MSEEIKDTSNPISLSDLSQGAEPIATPTMMPLPKLNPKNVKEANVKEIVLPKEKDKPVKTSGNVIVDSALSAIPETIERLRNESLSLIRKGEEERIEEQLNSDIEDEVIINNITPDTQVKNTSPDWDEDGLFDDEEEVINMNDNILNNEEEIKHKEVTKKIVFPVSDTPEDREKLLKEVINEMDTFAPEKEETETTSLDENDNTKPVIEVSSIPIPDDDDIDLLDEEDNTGNPIEEESEESIKNRYREAFKNTDIYQPIKKLDLSKFSISKKPISASKVLNNINHTQKNTADSVLFNANRAVKMTELDAIDISKFDPELGRNNNYYSFMTTKYRIIYNAIVDGNKPSTFEAWMKLTHEDVIMDYFFAAYKATFGTSNILTYNCMECDNVFLNKTSIESMIKFKNEDIKKKYYDILHTGAIDTSSDMYEAQMYQVSNKYAVTLKKPSLYNTFIEPTLISDDFAKKYETLMNLIPYIDEMYIIDTTHGVLIPIDTKPDPRNPSNTLKRRIKTFGSILRTLNSDEIQLLGVETNKFDRDTEKEDDIKYIVPECTCPKCNKKIAEVEERPDNMLFTRHLLAALSKI